MASALQKEFYADLEWRGLIHQSTDPENIPAWLDKEPRTVYAGFDPTADSLHVGHLMGLIGLRKFQRAGHTPIAIVGGATGMIGDPSGRSDERNLLDRKTLEANVAGIKKQVEQVLDFDSGAVLVNNYDWMSQYSYLDFLRDIGKNFPVNVMLTKDSVKSRLEGEAGLSYTEFSYMLIQAFDFVTLNRKFGCELQIGGSDQWGNITAGIDLARRMDRKQLYGMTWPLLTNSDGTKMGKTAAGAVWLSPERTSPYAFYQYWINISDESAGRCLRCFTDLEREEIETLDKSREEEPHRKESQKRLAEEITKMIHGESGLETALKATKVFFGGELAGLSESQLIEVFSDVPSHSLSKNCLQDDEQITIVEGFVAAGLAKSNGEARRTIAQGGGYINNQRIEDVNTKISSEHLASETVVVLRSGKKKFALLRYVN